MRIVVSHQLYDHISECVRQAGPATNDNITFTCNGVNNENRIFNSAPGEISCSAGESYRHYFGRIEFRGCRFSEMRDEFFDQYPNLHSLWFSDMEGGTLDLKFTKIGENEQFEALFASPIRDEIGIPLRAFWKNGKYINIKTNSYSMMNCIK